MGLSLSPSGHVFIIPLLNSNLSVGQNLINSNPSPPTIQQLFLSNIIMLDLRAPRKEICAYGSMEERACLYLCISVSVCLSCWGAVCSLRRLNQASATWPWWLRPSWAQLIHASCGLDMSRTKKHEEWEGCKDRRNSRQWMIMMTRAILLASVVPPPSPPLPPPWPWPWLWICSHMDE